MIEPNRLMVAGDWHGNLGWARNAVKYADQNGCDVIVHAGDFGVWNDNQHDNEYLRKLQAELVEYGVTLYWVDGNHDSHERIAAHMPSSHTPWSFPEYPNIIHLPRGYRWVWFGKTWMALGGAVSVDKMHRAEGKSWWAGETLTLEDVERASRGKVDVIIAHDCPFGVRIPGVGPASEGGNGWPVWVLQESEEHRRLVRAVVESTRPTLYLHGHYHLRYQAFYQYIDGARCLVQGLDCDGSSMDRNTLFINRE
ncbi:metallophosphoesterase [Mycobacterium phage Gaia]|uniref:Metallophosphoesterase n=1 Tax=Mycobacterium phage Gaia TaxID=1486472 RepID=A0A068F1Y7_9CAUD|nr:metallo-phosphoesterase [Mycobacterium phage Gaia]AID58962.1 metallophosphoesterase [Mycobacterium phage Gaia]